MNNTIESSKIESPMKLVCEWISVDEISKTFNVDKSLAYAWSIGEIDPPDKYNELGYSVVIDLFKEVFIISQTKSNDEIYDPESCFELLAILARGLQKIHKDVKDKKYQAAS